MSQGPDLHDKKNNPWFWTDRTIGSLMKELNKLREMVVANPNNYELGKKVRAWHYDALEEQSNEEI